MREVWLLWRWGTTKWLHSIYLCQGRSGFSAQRGSLDLRPQHAEISSSSCLGIQKADCIYMPASIICRTPSHYNFTRHWDTCLGYARLEVACHIRGGWHARELPQAPLRVAASSFGDVLHLSFPRRTIKGLTPRPLDPTSSNLLACGECRVERSEIDARGAECCEARLQSFACGEHLRSPSCDAPFLWCTLVALSLGRCTSALRLAAVLSLRQQTRAPCTPCWESWTSCEDSGRSPAGRSQLRRRARPSVEPPVVPWRPFIPFAVPRIEPRIELAPPCASFMPAGAIECQPRM